MDAAEFALERARAVRSWVRERSPNQFLVAGWTLFVILAYPGYLSFVSIEQFGEMRAGFYSDRYPALMTFVWSAFEWVVAGPASMLVLQSGLFLFGLAAILRKVLTPRAAAIVASCVLLVPPVGSPMSVIWPESLMAGALLAAAGCALSTDVRWRIAGGGALVLACSCRPEIVVAAIPLALFAFAGMTRRRAVASAAITVVLASGVARVADWILVDDHTGAWTTGLMVGDTIGTLRKAGVTDRTEIEAALAGLSVVPDADLGERVHRANIYDVPTLMIGDRRVIDRPSPDQLDDLRAAWRGAIADHLGDYLWHRYLITKRLLGFGPPREHVFEGFGEPGHIAMLHHRATPSDLQLAMRAITKALSFLYPAWLWLLGSIVAFALVRTREIRLVIASGWIWLATLFFLAPVPDYRLGHYLIVTAAIGLAARIAKRWSV